MPLYKVQRSVQGANGTTRDEYVNTFYLLSPGVTNVTDTAPDGQPWAKGLATTLDAFWLSGAVNGVTPLEYMSRRYQGPSVTKFYLETYGLGPLGPPVAVIDDGVAFVPPDVQSLPEECAVCLSYNVVPAGVIPARARGRIYIGPLSIAAMDDVQDNDQPVRVTGALQTALLSAGGALQASLNAAGWEWHLYSRANNNNAKITNWSIDNAFDTIRNRGTAPSLRISG